MSQLMITDAFAQAKRHLSIKTPPSVLLTLIYDRQGGCRIDGLDIHAWNKWAQDNLGMCAVTKQGVGKTGKPYKILGFLEMFRYAVISLLFIPVYDSILAQTLLDGFRAKKHLHDSPLH